jgi:hypothetical protein
VKENDTMEERLRHALRAVAELPGRPQPASGPPRREGQRDLLSPVRRHPRLVASIVSVAAIAAAVSLLVAYGPHNAPGPLSHPKVPASHPTTSTTTPPPPASTTSTSTTTTTVPAVTVGTERITYQPFVGSALDPSLHVTGRQSGACFEYGGGADGRSLYRCGTMQPCFEGPQGSGAPLVCPSGDVTADNVVEFSATSIDTSYVPATTRTPWAMQLSTGQVCTLVNAAWSGLGPFGCDGTPAADCHPPQASSPLWTADCQDALNAASPFTAMTVEKVWF